MIKKASFLWESLYDGRMAVIENAYCLPSLLKGKERLMGLDFGTKHIGVSLSDTELKIASPLCVIKVKQFTKTAQELHKLIMKHNVGGIILGLPLNMKGDEGRRAQSVRAFGRNFLAFYDLPLVFFDERLSTQAVNKVLLEANRSRKRRQMLADKMAASYILQNYLDMLLVGAI